MKKYDSQWFGGAGEKSMAEAHELHRMLEQALEELSGIQQPPRPGTRDNVKAYEREKKKSEKRIDEIAQNIYTALTGRIITKDRKVKNKSK